LRSRELGVEHWCVLAVAPLTAAPLTDCPPRPNRKVLSLETLLATSEDTLPQDVLLYLQARRLLLPALSTTTAHALLLRYSTS